MRISPFASRRSWKCPLTITLLLAGLCGLPGLVAQEPIRRIWEARRLSITEIQEGKTADIEGVVQIYDYIASDIPYHSFYLCDQNDGIYVNYRGSRLDLAPGQSVRVQGRIGPGLYAPELIDPLITPLGNGTLPEPLRLNYEELASGKYDCQRVEMQGVIRAVGRRSGRLCIQLGIGAAHLPMTVAGEDDVGPQAELLIDAVVRVQGAARTFFNSQRQAVDVGLYCSGFDAFKILDPPAEPERLPPIRAGDLLTFSRDIRPGRRVKIQGIVTYHSPGELLFIEDQERGLLIRTKRKETLHPGNVIEVLGFPAFGVSGPILEDGICRLLAHGKPVIPREISYSEASSGKYEATLVSLQARVLDDTRQGNQRRLWLQSGSESFQAFQPLPESGVFKQCPIQTEIKVEGICLAHGPLKYRTDTGWMPPAFELYIPAGTEPQILRRPPWWTPPRVSALLAIVATGLLATAGWARRLRRKVQSQAATIHHQIAEQAALRERNRIARELHDTLAQGFAATAFQLEALGEELTTATSKARAHLSMALLMVRQSLIEARRSVAGLRSEALAIRDLPHALRSAGEMILANSNVAFSFQLTGTVRTLAPGFDSNLLRIGQEAITNALRHANPKVIRLDLSYAAHFVTLTIEDDGCGFASDGIANQSAHFGLTGMRERVVEIGGTISIDTAEGTGTRLRIVVPFAGKAGGIIPMPS